MLWALLVTVPGLHAPARIQPSLVRVRTSSPHLQLSPYEEWVRKRGGEDGQSTSATAIREPPSDTEETFPTGLVGRVVATQTASAATEGSGRTVSVAAPPRRVSQPPPIQQMIADAADLLSRQPVLDRFVRAPAAAALTRRSCPGRAKPLTGSDGLPPALDTAPWAACRK
jgi:hypothetical protein